MGITRAKHMGDISRVHADMLRRHHEESDSWEVAARSYKQRLNDNARDEVDRVVRDANERFETCKLEAAVCLLLMYAS